MLQRLKDLAEKSDSCNGMAIFRMAFGFILVIECFRYGFGVLCKGLARLSESVADAPWYIPETSGWIHRYFIAPELNFTYWGFHWIKPLPRFDCFGFQFEGMNMVFLLLAIASFLVAIGLFYRVAATAVFILFSYIFLLEQANYLNHFYLIVLISFLMIFVPAHRRWSADARRHPELAAASGPGWALWMLRFQVGVPYFFGGIAKINGDWLTGEPMRKWLAVRTDFPIFGGFFQEEWMVYFMSYSGLLLDLLVVPALLWRPTRLPALLAITLFHIMNAKLFSIGIFPWFMIFATWALFYNRDFGYWMTGDPPSKKESGTREALPRWLLISCAVWIAIQVLLPFRHWLYPGDVNWTEEGHRFSWHMKLRDKDCTVFNLRLIDPENGKTLRVNPYYSKLGRGEKNLLSKRQFRKMLARPYLLKQFVDVLMHPETEFHTPPTDWEDFWSTVRNRDRIQVKAMVMCRLNQREAQVLVDPEADLTKVKWGLAPSPWVTQLE